MTTFVAKFTLEKVTRFDLRNITSPTVLDGPLVNQFFKHLDNFLWKKNFVNHDDVGNAFLEFVSQAFMSQKSLSLFLVGNQPGFQPT